MKNVTARREAHNAITAEAVAKILSARDVEGATPQDALMVLISVIVGVVEQVAAAGTEAGVVKAVAEQARMRFVERLAPPKVRKPRPGRKR